MKHANTLSAIAADAREQCNPEKFNLVLEYELPFSAIGDAFVQGYEERALLWIKDSAPSTQHFSHGQYFKGEAGIQYVLDELQKKPTSRRALLSLICMDDLLGKHPERTSAVEDAPLPAFLILQFAISNNVLYATAYFRALEVAEFLPINLAEIAIHCRRIRNQTQNLELLRLTVVAFRAYSSPGFRCLQKASIDAVLEMDIYIAVKEGDIPKLKMWLGDKLQPDSAILLNGLESLRQALGRVADTRYTSIFRNAIDDAISALSTVRDLRQNASEGPHLENSWGAFKTALQKALHELETRTGA